MAGMHEEDSYAVFSGDDSDPVSSVKYIGTFVFTAPVVEPPVMSFTVPLDACTIVATTLRTLRRQTALSLRPHVPWECLRRDVLWWWLFLSWWCLRFCLGQCEADSWIYFFNYFQYQQVVGCVRMLNYGFSNNDEICADNYNYSVSS